MYQTFFQFLHESFFHNFYIESSPKNFIFPRNGYGVEILLTKRFNQIAQYSKMPLGKAST